MRHTLGLIALLALGAAFSLRAQQDETHQWRGADLAFPDGRNADWLPDDLLRLYQIVEDEDAGEEKALRVYVDQRSLAERDIPILRSPPLELPVGLYKVTVRVKMTGMLNVIGNSVRFDARRSPDPTPLPLHNDDSRYFESTLHGYHFRDEDIYHEFTLLKEVIEPDSITHRPHRPDAKSSFGRLIPMADLEAWKRGEGDIWQRAEREKAQPAPTDPEALAKLRRGTLRVELDYLKTMPLGFGRVQPSIRHLTIDWVKVEPVAEPPHPVVRKVVPNQLWMRPAADTSFDIWLHNRGGEERQGTLRLTLHHGLSERIVVGERQVTLGSPAYSVERFAWTAPDRDLWGLEAVAELLVDGEVVSQAADNFSVHFNPWAVMNFGGANRWQGPYGRLPSYRNFLEVFGVTPGDGLKPMPDDPQKPYISGMSDFPTSLETQKMHVEYNQRIGVSNFLYIQPANGTSYWPQLVYERRPEWFSGPLGWNDQMHEAWVNGEEKMREAWYAGEPWVHPTNLLHIETPVNYAIPEFYETLVSESIANVQYVGWDGIRWDANFPVRTVTNKHISFGPGSPEADRQMSAALSRRFKAAARAAIPTYTEGANIGVPDEVWNRNFADQVDEVPSEYHDVFLSDGSSAMDEGWMNAWIFTDPRNVIRDYYWGARRSVEWCRERGGFFHGFTPMRDGVPYFTQSIIYYNLLMPMAGASYPGPYSCTPGSETGVSHFVTRFSEFIYDLELQPLEDAMEHIFVDADREIWADGARWRDLPDGRRRYVIPLINPPTIERFMLRDRFSELPEPFRDPFPVEIETPEGFESARVWMLTAEPRTAVVELEADADDALVYVEVPELTIYRMLVVEFSKEAN